MHPQKGPLAPPLTDAALLMTDRSTGGVLLRRRPEPALPKADMRFDISTTDLVMRSPGGRRLAHALAYQAPLRFAGRVVSVASETTWARVRDSVMSGPHGRPLVLRRERGLAAVMTAGRRIALYAHFSPSGTISPMVIQQLAIYREQGFDVIFTTNAPVVDEASWWMAAEHCCWMVQRRNLGFDFGAWQEAAALFLAGRPPPDELLLVNDSVVGPLYPLGPLFSRARSIGKGAVGLTESHQGGVHLQSYFILALGQAASADTLAFLATLKLSTSKWLMVQRGEFGLTRHLHRHRHRVVALFGYARGLDEILSCPSERLYLTALVANVARHGALGESLRDVFMRWPLNPTQHLWRGLPLCLGFPFLKTALLARNPGRLPGLESWRSLFASEVVSLATNHLARV
jgi:hypothetical protein